MLSSSPAFQAAVVADSRKTLLRVIVDISDPDLVFGAITYSGIASDVCVPGQVEDKVFQLVPYGTLETDRWILDGTMQIFPDSPSQLREQAGFIGDVLSGPDGTYETPVWVGIQFENVSILQACSVYFPTAEYDGVPDTFTVEVKQGGTAYYTKTFTGNTESTFHLDGFTVMNPDAIRVTVSKWSRADRRLRVVEIVPGIYEEWDDGALAEFNVVQQANFSCLALPYGTCELSMDNLNRRFEPRSKDGVFQSIEERQNIDVSIGMALPDGSLEYLRVGRFYQAAGGWKTGDNGITMKWSLVDIIGLLADRQYLPPATLPTTLEGWVASITAQLGENFAERYLVASEYAALPLTASMEGVTGKSCGEILRMACMATGTFPRADSYTGKLAVEPYWNQGGLLDLDNLSSYPVIKANDDIAALIFTLYDGTEDGTEYVVSGNSTASNNTVAIQNPFIHDQAAALTAARLILSTYGGNQLETTGRGNPASEIGDVDTVQLSESAATTGRRMSQSFSFSSGVMQGCQSTLLQADGAFMFENRTIITTTGQWTAPAGATQLRVILVGGGSGGHTGADGTWDAAGEDGADGTGALIWAGTIQINPQQTFEVTIGQGGGIGQDGTATVFGQYSSDNGQRYSPSYTDVASGNAYGRTGVQSPAPNTGDGGKGGEGGIKGNRHEETIETEWSWETIVVVDNDPGQGTPGTAGASGCVVIYWDKGE